MVNKQEALEAILEEARKYETGDGMDAADGVHRAGKAFVENADVLVSEGVGIASRQDSAIRAAGALLFLVVTERG